MVEVMKDRRGNEIREGSRVAYNLSGEVALGTITRIVSGTPRENHPYSWNVWAKKPVIYIKPDSEWSRIASGRGESKLLIYEADGVPIGKVLVLKCDCGKVGIEE
jgi:hypothetical protein